MSMFVRRLPTSAALRSIEIVVRINRGQGSVTTIYGKPVWKQL